MAKLKFNRKIYIRLASKETVRVPEDEVWKVTHAAQYANSMEFVGNDLKNSPTLLGGGTTARASENGSLMLSGIAFKIVQ